MHASNDGSYSKERPIAYGDSTLSVAHPARGRGVQPRCDVHALQLLEQQLGGVGDVQLRAARLILARAALEALLLQVGDSSQAAAATESE
jgi:hypothetical protein